MSITDISLRWARLARGAVFGLSNAPDWVGNKYNGTDKFSHGYLPYYRAHLGPRRFRKQLVFEIGVGGHDSAPGGSLAMWRDLMMRSTVVGLDIRHKEIDFGARVYFHQADQSAPADLQAVVDNYGRPDVVIDDGSHVGEHIHASFDFFWPLLRPGGLYIIEDLATSYDPGYGGSTPVASGSGVGLVQALADEVQSRDPSAAQRLDSGHNSNPEHPDVTAVHTYPGIAFVEKASARPLNKWGLDG